MKKISSGDESSANASPEKQEASEGKSFTTFSEQGNENENENDYAKSVEEDSSRTKSEGIDLIIE